MAGTFKGAALALVACLLHGCATQAPAPNYAVVRTFYATDRSPTGSREPRTMYGAERAALSYGTCDVSIPRRHEPGALESPSVWRLEAREDPEKHVVLLAAQPLFRADYYAGLREALASAKRPRAFVFVHGYNVSFDGVPVFYSWPSQGTTAGYPRDEESVQLTMPHLQQFLADFFERSAAEDVYLVAHSMGNRALTAVLARLLEEKPAIRGRLKEIILSAPDINVEIFKEQIYPALAKAGLPMTLYASSEDVALAASKQFHGYARLGDSRPVPVVLEGIETIDATGVDVSFLKHSYFAEARPLLADLRTLILQGARAGQRSGLNPVRGYWVFARP